MVHILTPWDMLYVLRNGKTEEYEELIDEMMAGRTCPVCHGEGELYVPGDLENPPEYEPCPLCEEVLKRTKPVSDAAYDRALERMGPAGEMLPGPNDPLPF